MRIVVISPGMLTTVQDLGRPGYGVEGVSRAGAADGLALRIGNRLVGNPETAAALEMTMLGGTFHFPDGATIAMTGARPAEFPAWRAVRVEAGETVKTGTLEGGARCYVCVRGGIRAQLIAGSASVHLLSGLGGGPLRKGQELEIGEAAGVMREVAVPAELTTYSKLLRVTRGPQAEFCSEEVFYDSTYRISSGSNRMGLRLEGPAVPVSQPGEMITEGVALGAIQIPANGQPIVLFVDQQTTGGYPKIANVITADLPSVGQLRPGDRVSFALVSYTEARELLLEQEALLETL